MSSELVSDDEEEETPHNILTNVTESGIDVNTVTDLQKLKAKGILGSQNNNRDLVSWSCVLVISPEMGFGYGNNFIILRRIRKF